MGKYNKNFIQEVIFRIDFPSKIISPENLNMEISAEILKNFPIKEPKKRIENKVEINQKTEEAIYSKEEVESIIFYGRNREKYINIEEENIVISFKEYSSFFDFKSSFIGILEKIFSSIQGINASRIGLRYIDVISIDEGEPTDWSGYINKKLTCGFNFVDSNIITRLFQVLDYKKEDYDVKFQYGMHNPDFPAPIKKKTFVLDTDIYSQGLFYKDDIINKLDLFHSEAKYVFEEAIEDKLRKKMNE